MPKLGMEPIRRKQLIEATVETIHAHGFAEATVKQISARAGVSSGIIHHYFGGKDALLAATMRALLRDLQRAVAARLAEAKTPHERLDAVIDGCFSRDQFSGAVQTAWLSFWAQTPHSPALKRLARVYLSRLRSTLRHDLKTLLPEAEAAAAASGLAALIDGLWLTAAVSPETVDPEAARTLARTHLSAHLSAHPAAPPRAGAAPQRDAGACSA